MKVFTATEFKGHYPVGTAAVIVARDRGQARKLLEAAVEECGLKLEFFKDDLKKHFVEVDISEAHATVLLNGDY